MVLFPQGDIFTDLLSLQLVCLIVSLYIDKPLHRLYSMSTF